MMNLIWYLLPMGVISGFLGVYVANQKNRNSTEGFVLGFLFSLVGVIILALLPSNDKPIERKQYASPTKPFKQKEPLNSSEKNFIGVLAIVIMLVVIYTLWKGRQ